MTPERMKHIRAEIESAMSFKTPALRELGATAQWLVDALVVERDRVAELDAADLARSATIRGLRQRVTELETVVRKAIRVIRSIVDPDEAMADAQAVLWAVLPDDAAGSEGPE